MAEPAPPRLREGPKRPHNPQPVDAEVWVAPKFAALAALAVVCVILQATLLAHVSVGGAQVGLLTVLIVWTGLRCGVTTGGWLGLLGGICEDALGGHGLNVVGTTLIGFGAGMLSSRFFHDSFPIFVGATAAATLVRAGITYIVLETAFGYRGLFEREAHSALWLVALNCATASVVIVYLRLKLRPRAALRSKAA
ncbi:MAG: hypothetical protein M3T49_07910 [Candidatus Eremiobacteraeota bacterium]|nr:hypothetical protein [Candidatus Eremiobacteraeota bacterium]